LGQQKIDVAERLKARKLVEESKEFTATHIFTGISNNDFAIGHIELKRCLLMRLKILNASTRDERSKKAHSIVILTTIESSCGEDGWAQGSCPSLPPC